MVKKEYSKNKKEKKREQTGSALVLMVLVLVNALIIVTVIASISIVERKMSSNVKHSTPAFQAADTGIEWVLKEIGDVDDSTKTISEVFGALSGEGKFTCPAGEVGGVNCYLYFVDISGEVILADTTEVLEIDSVRSVGIAGTDDEEVSRAVEVVLSVAGCPDGSEKVSDFCIEIDERDEDLSFEDAADACYAVDARLCTAAEWAASCALAGPLGLNDMTGNFERLDELPRRNRNTVMGGSDCNDRDEMSLSSGGGSDFRCCMNTN